MPADNAPRPLSPPARWLLRGSALAVAALAFLPIANWIAGGHDVPWYATVADGWLSGSAIALGLGVVLAIGSRRIDGLWRDGLLARPLRWIDARWPTFALLVALGAFACYLAVSVGVFSGRPLMIDEIAQRVQADIFAAGRLSLPVERHPEFFSNFHLLQIDGRFFTQFPPGGPAMLLPGVLVGAPAASVPLWGAATVLAFAWLLAAVEPRAAVRAGALLAFAFAPLMVFMSASQMNHLPTLMWLTLATAALAHALGADAPRPALAAVSGFALGAAATIRPSDALAFALPAGAWYLARAIREPRRWADCLAAGAGLAVPVGALLWYNAQTTGAPLSFAYEVMWGKAHGLGFHAAPYGPPHTPARGLELVNLYFLRLQTYLFETAVPSLVPAIAALALGRGLRPADRYLLAASALLVGLYFAYWFDGFYLGPRFVFCLLPLLALWSARFLPALRERVGTGLPYRAAIYATVAAVAVGAVVNVPIRVRQYSGGLLNSRWDVDQRAAAAGVSDALVFVRESWGTQLLVRLWALDITRSQTEHIYRAVDGCRLEETLRRLERDSVRGPAAYRALVAATGDSARLAPSTLTSDPTMLALPGARYSTACVAALRDDAEGFTLYPMLTLGRRGRNVYAHDLKARDSLLLLQYPDRPVYLMRPASMQVGAPPAFVPLRRDSLWAAWRSDGRGPARLPPRTASR